MILGIPLLDLANYAQAISAIAAVVTIFVYFFVRMASERQNEVREWQKVTIHKILARSDTKIIDFSKVHDRYRNESISFPGAKLSKKEVDESTLRRLLIEMVADGVVGQYFDDKYFLSSKSLPTEKVDSFVDPADMSKVMNALMRTIDQHPFEFDAARLAKKVAGEAGVNEGAVSMSISSGLGLNMLVADENGKLGLSGHRPDLLKNTGNLPMNPAQIVGLLAAKRGFGDD